MVVIVMVLRNWEKWQELWLRVCYQELFLIVEARRKLIDHHGRWWLHKEIFYFLFYLLFYFCDLVLLFIFIFYLYNCIINLLNILCYIKDIHKYKLLLLYYFSFIFFYQLKHNIDNISHIIIIFPYYYYKS